MREKGKGKAGIEGGEVLGSSICRRVVGKLVIGGEGRTKT
jgi:hypothetical protein